MYHRPIGCSESDYSSCLQLIREDDITCAQSSMVKVAIDNNDIDDNENVNGDYDGIAQMTQVAPLSSANEDVYGRPRHAEEAVRVAAVLREVLHDVFLPKIAARICQAIVQQNLQSII